MSNSPDERRPLLAGGSDDGHGGSIPINFTDSDHGDPRQWTRRDKLLNVFIIAFMSILSPLASSMFTPGIAQIADDLNTDTENVIATTTGFVIMLGIGPLILAPLSETFGRRPIYIACFGAFAILQIPTALSPNVEFLIAVRTVSGLFGSVGIANGGGTLSDMFHPSERASVFGWYLLGPLLGPTIGPLLGGVILQRMGWRWIYWILAIVCCSNTLVGYFFLKETYAPAILGRRKSELMEQNGNGGAKYYFEGEDKRPLLRKIVGSLKRPIVIFVQPIVLVMSLYQALIFGTTYSIYTNMQDIYSNEPYLFNTEQIGLLYLGPGLGFLTAVWFLVPRIDTVFNKLTERNKGNAMPEYRLPLANIGSVLIPTSLFWFAWTVEYRLHWFVTIFATYFYGVGQVVILNTVQNYYIDSFSNHTVKTRRTSTTVQRQTVSSPPKPPKSKEDLTIAPLSTRHPSTTVTIAPSTSRSSSSHPLRTLTSPSRPSLDEENSTSLLAENEKEGNRRSSLASDSDDTFSLWSDTGDIAEQLAEDEDPLRIQLQPLSSEGQPLNGGSREKRKKKSVHYPAQDQLETRTTYPGVDKEAIQIPEPAERTPSKATRLLGVIMAPGSETARRRGLVGKPLLYFTSVFVSLGVFLFGYDQGVMSGIITGPYFRVYFNQPGRAEVGTMVAILEVGAFIASLIVGRLGDILGRCRTILYGSMVFLVGGAFQTFANGMPMMLVGRILAGLGVGALSTIVPVYQSEISPPHNRGKLACIEFSGNIIGYAASVWVDYFCSYIDNDWAWRVPLLLQCVMGALLGLGSWVIPESPRWLLDNDHDEEGIIVIANLYGGGDIHDEKARQEYREIKMNVLLQRQEGERSYRDMFRRYSKRVFIAMSAQALAQLNGINVISYYAPLVFESAGWIGRDAILMTGINALTYLAATVPPWYVVDKWGRRPILLSGALAMIISLSLISYFIFIDVHYTPTLVVIFVMIYNASFGASWGPIPWLYPPEILPLSIRAKGASLSTAANWAFNWLVGELTPVLQEWIKWRLYLLHAFWCAVSFVVVYFVYPETANVRLEDMNELFGDATTAMPTPATQAEQGSLMGYGSPNSIDIRRGTPTPGVFGAGDAIPGLDIDPPDIHADGKPTGDNARGRGRGDSTSEGLGGWITRMVSRTRRGSRGDTGNYRRIDQDDE
ncbi:MAG: hypothetical protein Q9227_008613 [Pyrenula ochraceoflavens]